MSRYSIEGSTLTAIGDAVRAKVGTTRIEYIPKEAWIFKTDNVNSLEDVTNFVFKDLAVRDGFRNDVSEVITIPGAKKLTLKIAIAADYNEYYYELPEYSGTVWYSAYTLNHQIKEYEVEGDTITINVRNCVFTDSNAFYAEVRGYDENGNQVKDEDTLIPIEVKNTLTPNQMAEEINNLPQFPSKEAFNITGSCAYRFAYGGWDWFINLYPNKITTSNITDCKYMFMSSNLSEIPFVINVKPEKTTAAMYWSYLFQASKIKKAPYIYVSGMDTPTNASRSIAMDYMFAGCNYLKEIPYDFFNVMITDNDDFWNAVKNYGPNRNNMFASCYSLRELPDITNLNHRQEASYHYSYSLYYNMLNRCSSLNEAKNIPVIDSSKVSSNCFYNCFNGCYRIKNITFATNENGTPIAWTNQTIDLSSISYNSVGFCGGNVSYENQITEYNSGITKDKKVTDAVSYEALKNDPDWYSCLADYSRYNHDSAVATINSLPDVSSGSGNTIKFLGAAGALTDGGAINTLTEEEIAVATAKGWTVSLV